MKLISSQTISNFFPKPYFSTRTNNPHAFKSLCESHLSKVDNPISIACSFEFVAIRERASTQRHTRWRVCLTIAIFDFRPRPDSSELTFLTQYCWLLLLPQSSAKQTRIPFVSRRNILLATGKPMAKSDRPERATAAIGYRTEAQPGKVYLFTQCRNVTIRGFIIQIPKSREAPANRMILMWWVPSCYRCWPWMAISDKWWPQSREQCGPVRWSVHMPDGGGGRPRHALWKSHLFWRAAFKLGGND